jgi:hypothetical protein
MDRRGVHHYLWTVSRAGDILELLWDDDFCSEEELEEAILYRANDELGYKVLRKIITRYPNGFVRFWLYKGRRVASVGGVTGRHAVPIAKSENIDELLNSVLVHFRKMLNKDRRHKL